MLGDGGFAKLNERLAKNYAILEDVLDYDHSATCEKEKQCDLEKSEHPHLRPGQRARHQRPAA